MAVNIASWARHAEAALDTAERGGASVVLLSEASVGSQSDAGFTAMAFRLGWQALHSSSAHRSGRVGGLAIL
eukprot:9169883-Alexandrium_andersonii.AAC.1